MTYRIPARSFGLFHYFGHRDPPDHAWHEVESAVQSRYAVTPSYKVKPRKCAQSSVPLLASHLKTVAAAAQEEEGEDGGAT